MFLTSTFRDDDLLNISTLRPDDSRSWNVHDRRFTRKRRSYQVLIAIQMIHHEKPTLEGRKVTKLLHRDTTSSNDDFTSYRRSIKLIRTTSTPYLVKNETLDSYPEGATLSKFIFTKEDRQLQNRLLLLFQISPAILPSTYVRKVHLVNHKLPFTNI